MDEKFTSRRRFLRAAPLAVGLTAGCQSPASRTTDSVTGTTTTTSTTENEETTSTTDTDGETTTASDDTGAPISTAITPDVLSYHPRRARVIREFLPDAGPASIAVGFPLDRTAPSQGYCFDAGPCRLRYAWAGEFISIPYTKDDGPATLDGRVYYRRRREFPLRFGAADRTPEPVEFRGYALVDRLPEFRYAAGGVTVRHLVRPLPDGRGLRQTFEIPDPGGPVWYVPGEADASVEASAGEWRDGRLRLRAAEATSFTVTMEWSE